MPDSFQKPVASGRSVFISRNSPAGFSAVTVWPLSAAPSGKIPNIAPNKTTALQHGRTFGRTLAPAPETIDGWSI